MSYDSSKSAILLLWFFFTRPLLYLCVPANDENFSEKISQIFTVFSNSIFKVLGIYCLKIHNWHGFLSLQRYYAFLHLKLKLRGRYFISISLKLYSSLEHLTVLMLDMLHPYMSIVYTYHYRGVLKKKCLVQLYSFLLGGRIECCLLGNCPYCSDIVLQDFACVKLITYCVP